MSIQGAFLPVAAYLVGSIPFGLVVGRLRGVDVRAHGSGNIGATNVARVVGKEWGLLTLVLDFLKGFLPTWLAWRLGGTHLVALTGGAAVLGHCFSIFLKFRGGKGVATAAGVFAAVSPAALGAALLVFGAGVGLTGFVSVGSLAAALTLPVALHLFHAQRPLLAMAWLLAGVIWWKHRANIGRLLRGQEKGWKKGESGLGRGERPGPR